MFSGGVLPFPFPFPFLFLKLWPPYSLQLCHFSVLKNQLFLYAYTNGGYTPLYTLLFSRLYSLTILSIYLLYTLYIPSVYHLYYLSTERVQMVFTRYLPGPYQVPVKGVKGSFLSKWQSL